MYQSHGEALKSFQGMSLLARKRQQGPPQRALGAVCDRSDVGGSTLNAVTDPFRVDTAAGR